MLPKRPAFPAFPGLEFAAADELGCLAVLSSLIVKRAKFDTQIIAAFDEIQPLAQFPQVPLGFLTEALPKLIAFIKKPRIDRIGAERAFISCSCHRRLM